MSIETLLVAFDLAGTFVFALSGATAGVRHKLDLFGVLVLSIAAANSGGILRDLLIGAIPPTAVSDWRYIAVSLLAGVVVFLWYPTVNRLRSPVMVFDAAGLALFAVAGVNKALAYHLGPGTAILLGVLTGIGGGMMRDILLAHVPSVLWAELYAVAAFAGATVVALGHLLNLPSAPVTLVAVLLCFGLRYGGIRRGWRLPTAHFDLDDEAHDGENAIYRPH
jgi:uncharacterized membrane protein YeiH